MPDAIKPYNLDILFSNLFNFLFLNNYGLTRSHKTSTGRFYAPISQLPLTSHISKHMTKPGNQPWHHAINPTAHLPQISSVFARPLFCGMCLQIILRHSIPRVPCVTTASTKTQSCSVTAKEFPVLHSHALPPSPNPRQPLTCSPSLSFCHLRMSCKQNHPICNLLR